MPKRTRRSFAACWTCRRRRIACDGGQPHCSPCRKHRVACEGYDIQLVWVDSETGAYRSHSRRSLNPHVTWSSRIIFGDEELDHLIESAEGDCKCKLHDPNKNPFRVLKGLPSFAQVSAALRPTAPIPNAFSSFPDRPAMESFLFNHYVTQVSYLMIPVDSDANPWRSTYPSIAVQDSSAMTKSLYHALVSQAAFHLCAVHTERSENCQKFRAHALQHYGLALRIFRESLERPMVDFTSAIATLLTLVNVEGSFATEAQHEWAKHFQGASSILVQFIQERPWLNSTQAWVIAQSLALSSEVTQTGRLGHTGASPITEVLLRPVSAFQNFAYTIGACRTSILAISSIRLLREDLSRNSIPDDFDAKVAQLISELSIDEEGLGSDPMCVPAVSSKDRKIHLAKLHRRIFRTAVLIHLYRTIFAVSPCAINSYITSVLSDVMAFLDLNGGSLSVWPVFIAAVEASTEEQRIMVQRWLKFSLGLGMQNRHTAKRIIGEVWRQRDDEASKQGLQPSEVTIDWRYIQRDLGVDILLL